MTALIVVDLTPTNKERLSIYSALAAKSIANYGGEFIGKGPIEVLHGKSSHQIKAVIQFPDKASVLNWYNSDEYQQIIPIRDQGMDSQFHLVG